MKRLGLVGIGACLCWSFSRAGPLPVLQRSDVVFMYQADRQTYTDYGATVVAWGGRPNARVLEAARGLKFFGSVGMVTEFARYYDRFPDTYAEGLCRNLDGQPYKVPWLTDHQHKGVPYWWCCPRQPLFRQYLAERVTDTVKAGAYGVHIDDHLGTAGSLGLGGCFCQRCVEQFQDYLKALPKETLARCDVTDPAQFNYRDALRAWLAQKPGRHLSQHLLWPHWRIYQLKGAAAFIAELRTLAAGAAGRPVPMGANACLLWGPHLADYQSLDLFSAEIPHQAETRRFSDDPIVAYRLAEAVGRPLAATASGGDWAFIKAQQLPGLVRGWIALGYAAGHCLMVPHRQWCYTPQLGTHWYDGPKEKFAPLYQFVRQHAQLFDPFQTYADVTVAVAHRTLDRDTRRVVSLCNQLTAAHLSYRLLLGGDEIVDHPLPSEDLQRAQRLWVIEPKDFQQADQARLAEVPRQRRYETMQQLLTQLTPAVRPESPDPVRVFPRIAPGRAVLHLINWQYDPSRDDVVPIHNLKLRLQLAALGVGKATEARLCSPGTAPVTLPIQDGQLTVPELGLWAIVELTQP